MFSHFLLMALLASAAASIASGIIGSYVVVRRIVFISGSIAHSVLGGMGLFLYLKRTFNIEWLQPIYGALLTALLAAYLIGWIHIHYKQREDTVIACLWAIGMAIGVIFISLTPGYNVELTSFLFGNILWTSWSDIYLLLILDVIVIITCIVYHKKFVAICFDREQAYLQKLPVKRLYFLLLSLIAITVVVLIQIIGAILVIALLCLPPAIANLFINRLSTIMRASIFITLILSLLGTSFAYILNWPPGATIALVSTISYLGSLSLKTKFG